MISTITTYCIYEKEIRKIGFTSTKSLLFAIFIFLTVPRFVSSTPHFSDSGASMTIFFSTFYIFPVKTKTVSLNPLTPAVH